jgi:hypothetical protein
MRITFDAHVETTLLAVFSFGFVITFFIFNSEERLSFLQKVNESDLRMIEHRKIQPGGRDDIV